MNLKEKIREAFNWRAYGSSSAPSIIVRVEVWLSIILSIGGIILLLVYPNEIMITGAILAPAILGLLFISAINVIFEVARHKITEQAVGLAIRGTAQAVAGYVSPGDLADTISILSIKAHRLQDELQSHKINQLLEQKEEYKFLLAMHAQHKDLSEAEMDELHRLTLFLHNINMEQWDWEDRVRSEQSWEAAIGARECNSKRVEVKNEINKIFGYFTETKRYMEPQKPIKELN